MHESDLNSIKRKLQEIQKTSGPARRYPRGLKREVVAAMVEWQNESRSPATLCNTLGLTAKQVDGWQRELETSSTRQKVEQRRKDRSNETKGDRAPRSVFLPVQVRQEEAPAGKRSKVEVVVRGGRRIRIEGHPDKGVLMDLIACLESTPC